MTPDQEIYRFLTGSSARLVMELAARLMLRKKDAEEFSFDTEYSWYDHYIRLRHFAEWGAGVASVQLNSPEGVGFFWTGAMLDLILGAAERMAYDATYRGLDPRSWDHLNGDK